MNLLIAFNLLDLEDALETAALVADHADLFTVGPLLLYKYGVKAVERFHETFPQKKLLVEAQIIERPKESVQLFAKAGAQWVSVLAGAGERIIHTACSTANDIGCKIILDLVDASSVGQSALEAKGLGVKALSFHKPTKDDDRLPFVDRWHMIKGNTQLPIFISAHISRENIGEVLGLEPSGIIVGTSVTAHDNPQEEAAYFADLVKR